MAVALPLNSLRLTGRERPGELLVLHARRAKGGGWMGRFRRAARLPSLHTVPLPSPHLRCGAGVGTGRCGAKLLGGLASSQDCRFECTVGFWPCTPVSGFHRLLRSSSEEE
jgi:hypothetical protein